MPLMSIDASTIRFLKLRSPRWTGRAEQIYEVNKVHKILV